MYIYVSYSKEFVKETKNDRINLKLFHSEYYGEIVALIIALHNQTLFFKTNDNAISIHQH